MHHVFVWTPSDIVGVLLSGLLIILWGVIYINHWLKKKGWWN